MAAISPFLQPQAKPTITRGDQFGSEALEKKTETTNSQTTQQAKVDSYNTWNAFLTPTDVKFERLDTQATNTYSSAATAEPLMVTEERIPTFEELLAKVQNEKQDSGLRQNDNITGNEIASPAMQDRNDDLKNELIRQEFNIVEEKQVSKLEGSIFFSNSENIVVKVQHFDSRETSNDVIPSGVSGALSVNGVEGSLRVGRDDNSQESDHPVIGAKKEIKFLNKEKLMGSAESVANVTTKVSKRGFKEGKDVVGAVKDLWTNFIGFREKKPDPKAKENAEKAAKRKANKLRFIALLKEGMSIYYAEMRKALIELEVKLGVHALRAEDKNRLLGRNRNMSFEKLDSIYEIHQVAFAMAEQRRQQQQASKPAPTARGKASRGQIFTDKNLSGERSAGNNMMSAVG